MKFRFIARCQDQVITLDVSVPYKPGKQAQRARRVAVGELLAQLESQTASVDASGSDRIVVDSDAGVWVIGESIAATDSRGRV